MLIYHLLSTLIIIILICLVINSNSTVNINTLSKLSQCENCAAINNLSTSKVTSRQPFQFDPYMNNEGWGGIDDVYTMNGRLSLRRSELIIYNIRKLMKD
jgi:hypothetical protein